MIKYIYAKHKQVILRAAVALILFGSGFTVGTCVRSGGSEIEVEYRQYLKERDSIVASNARLELERWKIEEERKAFKIIADEKKKENEKLGRENQRLYKKLSNIASVSPDSIAKSLSGYFGEEIYSY